MWRSTISLLAAVFLLTACASTPTSSDSSSAQPAAPKYVVRSAPDEYQSLTNALTSPEDAARGKRQYDAKCSVCHGDNGEGDPDDPE
ncbi:MAG: cytochrome c, partial [bacterium]|nr:cytochrome c [bacterium]